MVVARKIDVEHKYVLTCDRELPVENQTVFYYRLPTLDEQYSNLGDEMEYIRGVNGEVTTRMKLDKSAEIKTLVNCITRIENFRDQDGNEVTWPADEAGRKKVLSQLEGVYRIELAEEIRTGDSLTEEEVKNSKPQSS